MNINIPEKQRPEFDRVATLAIEKETFTPSELAAELGIGVFIASIMVGYMEKAGLVTKGKGDDVRRAKITPTQWDELERRIENYQPEPEPKPEIFVPEEEETAVLNVMDIIPSPMKFMKKTLSASEGFITVDDGEIKTAVAIEDIAAIFLHKGRFFAKSTMTFAQEDKIPVKAKLRADTLCFKKSDYTNARQLALQLAQRLEIEVKEY